MSNDLQPSPADISLDAKPKVTNAKKKKKPLLLILFALIVVVGVFSAVSYFRNKLAHEETQTISTVEPTKKGEATGSQLDKAGLGLPDPKKDAPPQPEPPPVDEPEKSGADIHSEISNQEPAVDPNRPLLAGETVDSVAVQTPGATAQPVAARPRFSKAGKIVSVASGPGSSGAANEKPLTQEERMERAMAAAAAQTGGKASGSDDSLAVAIPDEHYAAVLQDRSYMIAAGTLIPCTLDTKMVTTVAGRSRCTIPINIYSDDGKILLVERGSEVLGEFQAGMKQGQARIFMIWTRLKTPAGVVVNLASPGAGELGEPGVGGYIDNHFFKRFGAAILVSVLEDAVAYAANKNNESTDNNTVNIGGSSIQSGTDIATEILKTTINIPPTLYKNQGEQLAIYVARDLKFTGVYDVRKLAQQ